MSKGPVNLKRNNAVQLNAFGLKALFSADGCGDIPSLGLGPVPSGMAIVAGWVDGRIGICRRFGMQCVYALQKCA